MCSPPTRSRPSQARPSAWTAGRTASRTGVRTPLAYTKTRGRRCPAPRVAALVGAASVVVAECVDPDRLELAPEPLDPVLAAHAGLDLGHRAQARRGDGLLALHADAVLAVVEALERREPDLAVPAGLDPVHLVGERRVVADRPGQLLNRHGAAHLAEPADCRVQVVLEPLPDVHVTPPGFFCRPGACNPCAELQTAPEGN